MTFLGFCSKQSPLGLCNYDLKTKLKFIEDKSIEVSSYDGRKYKGENARLRDKYSWCADTDSGHVQYIKIDLKEIVTISGISSQKCDIGYVTEYQIIYSYDGTTTWYYMHRENVIEVHIIKELLLTIRNWYRKGSTILLHVHI